MSFFLCLLENLLTRISIYQNNIAVGLFLLNTPLWITNNVCYLRKFYCYANSLKIVNLYLVPIKSIIRKKVNN